MSIVTHTDVQGFVSLEREWKDLLKRSAIDTIFLTWQWQRLWWEFFGQEAGLSILTVRDDGQLIGLAPLYASPPSDTSRTLRLIGGSELSDYLDIVAARGREEVVYSTLWEFLVGEYDYPWQAIDLHNVPGSSPTLATLPGLAKETKGVRVTIEVEDVCPVISLPPTWEDYLSLLTRKQRHELRRKIRKTESEATVRWYYAQDEETVDEEIQDFIDLHAKSSPQKQAFMDDRMQRFFQAVARMALEEGWLQLSFLLLDDVKAATMLCFDYHDSILLYNSGYDPQLYSSLSTGLVLLAYCIQDAMERGRKAFDFLRGDEEYKYRLGGQDTKVYHLRISK